jgi:hypothetical protein
MSSSSGVIDTAIALLPDKPLPINSSSKRQDTAKELAPLHVPPQLRRAHSWDACRAYTFKFLNKTKTIKLKIKMKRQYLRIIIIYPTKPSAGLSNLVRLSLKPSPPHSCSLLSGCKSSLEKLYSSKKLHKSRVGTGIVLTISFLTYLHLIELWNRVNLVKLM